MSKSDKGHVEKRPNTKKTEKLEKSSVDKPTLTSKTKKENKPRKK